MIALVAFPKRRLTVALEDKTKLQPKYGPDAPVLRLSIIPPDITSVVLKVEIE